MYTYDKIIGNEQLVSYLKKTVENGTTSHGYIFSSQPQMGKKLLAKTFAKALLCRSITDKPCGSCVSCRSFESGNNPDVAYIVSEKKSIGTDEIRHQLNSQMAVKPYKHNHKIFIVDKAETMTPAAQNALLKTLEEPPAYGVIMLLSSNMENILPTVQSRTVILKMPPLTDETVAGYLMKETGLDPQLAAMYSSFAQGSIGRGIMLFSDESFINMRNDVLNIMKSIKKLDTADILAYIPKLEAYKEKSLEILDIMYMWYTDVLAARSTGSDENIMQKDHKADILNEASISGAKSVSVKLGAIMRARMGFKYNVNFQAAMAALLLSLKET